VRHHRLAALLLALAPGACKEGTLTGGSADGQASADATGAGDAASTGDKGTKQSDGPLLPDSSGTPSKDKGGTPPPPDKGSTGPHNFTNLFFLHHSTGDALVTGGDMRGAVSQYNSSHGTGFAFWDHGYNGDGLRDAAGNSTGTNYAIPNDSTDPDGLHVLWTTNNGARQKILANHQVIAFKSCFPASAIADQPALDQRKSWYNDMRSFFDTRPDKLFVVMSQPPLHRLATNATEAKNARTFATWLCSPSYLQGHPNVVCFNLFDKLAAPDDGSAGANRLRYDYEESHSSDDSHPNALANQTLGPQLAQFLISAALAY
jgi:hypothetical protein